VVSYPRNCDYLSNTNQSNHTNSTNSTNHANRTNSINYINRTNFTKTAGSFFTHSVR